MAFATFAGNHPRATLTIAGDGPLRAELESLTAQLGMGARVRFAGFLAQEELRVLYASAHFFLHPSETTAEGDREGVPNSLLEAMATGLPISFLLDPKAALAEDRAQSRERTKLHRQKKRAAEAPRAAEPAVRTAGPAVEDGPAVEEGQAADFYLSAAGALRRALRRS